MGFVNLISSLIPDLEVQKYLRMEPVAFEWAGICKLIENMKLSSPGDHEINLKFLKNTAALSSILLSKRFSQSLETSALLDDWKVGKVVPLFVR